MKLLTETKLYDCDYNYYSVFPDFVAFALNDVSELNKELTIIHRNKVFETSNQIKFFGAILLVWPIINFCCLFR